MDPIRELANIASYALGGIRDEAAGADLRNIGRTGEDLISLLDTRDGFFAFESALHVLPLSSGGHERSIGSWNANDLWRHAYDLPGSEIIFFAEDIFGGQFGIRDDGVVSLDPETGGVELLAGNVSDWAREILTDFDVLVGHSVAHEWQIIHGSLPRGQRLIPKVPFVLGGEYTVSNLIAIDAVAGMKARGALASQIRDLPDGASIEFTGWARTC